MKPVIYTYTVIHSASEEFKAQVPYVVGVVEEGGKRVTARIEGYDPNRAVRIGMEVERSGNDSKGRPVYRFK